MNKKTFLLTTMAVVCTTICLGQSRTKIVELTSEAKIYKNASVSSGQVPNDTETKIMNAFTGKMYPYPFAQPVLEKQGEWLKIPAGWVMEKDTQEGGRVPFEESSFQKIYTGSLGVIKKHKIEDDLTIDITIDSIGEDLTIDIPVDSIDVMQDLEKDNDLTDDILVEYGVQLINTNVNNNEIAVIIYFPDTQLLARTRKKGNIIEAYKGLLIKYPKYEAERTEISFMLYDEEEDIKRYNILYGERLTTRRVEEFLGEIMTVETLDVKKMSSSDWNTVWDTIDKEGMAIKLYITASTLSQLKVEYNL